MSCTATWRLYTSDDGDCPQPLEYLFLNVFLLIQKHYVFVSILVTRNMARQQVRRKYIKQTQYIKEIKHQYKHKINDKYQLLCVFSLYERVIPSVFMPQLERISTTDTKSCRVSLTISVNAVLQNFRLVRGRRI